MTRGTALRRTGIALALLALLVVAYYAAGTWLAPRYVRDVLVQQAAQAGVTLRIAEVRTDPWRLSVTLLGLQALAPDGTTLGTARSASADLEWASLWGDAWIVEQAVLAAPDIRLVLGKTGELNWPAPPAESAPGKEGAKTGEAGGGLPAVLIQNLGVDEGALTFVDRSREAPVTVELRNITFGASSLQTAVPAEGGDGRAPYRLSAELASGGRLSSEGGLVILPAPAVAAGGSLSVSNADLSKLWSLAPLQAEAPRGLVDATARYVYGGKGDADFLVTDLAVTAKDLSYSLAGHPLPLQSVTLTVPSLAIPPSGTIEGKLQASLVKNGEISATGSLQIRPPSLEISLHASKVPLPAVQPWLSEIAAVDLVSGTLSATGKLRLAMSPGEGPPLSGGFEGSATLHDVRVEPAKGDEVLLAWERLATDSLRINVAPLEVSAGVVKAQSPEGRLAILTDGRTNFATLLAAREQAPAEPSGIAVSVERLQVENGTLHFADRSLENPFEVTLRELQGVISGISTAKADPAKVNLEGRVQKYGTAKVRGSLELDAPAARTTIRATLRNLDLEQFTPYFVKFAGYRIESGRLTADLRYRVRDSRLVGENELLIERLELGEKVESPTAADLPLEMAVALLTDARGRIDLGVPVSGDLRDPQFDFGAIMAKAVGNVVRKLVTAPFRAIAALAGGKKDAEDLASVAFEPGAATLPPPEEEDVDRIAKVLAERPRLAVSVQARFDPQADLPALRERAVRRAIAAEAGVPEKQAQTDARLDLGDPKIIDAAERLFLRRGGNRYALSQLRSGERPYGRALFQQLVQGVELEPGRAEALAKERAQAVQQALAARGVEPSRVRIEEPQATSTKGTGERAEVPTQLSLERAGARPAG